MKEILEKLKPSIRDLVWLRFPRSVALESFSKEFDLLTGEAKIPPPTAFIGCLMIYQL